MVLIRAIPAIIFFMFTGCNYNHVKDTDAMGPTINFKNLGPLDFAVVQMAVIGPRCLGCHANATGNKGSTNLESYANVRRLIPQISYRSLEKMDMPSNGKLSADEQQVLKDWIDQGAPEKSLLPREQNDPQLDQGPTDWKKISSQIFLKKCLDCHSQPQPQGGLDLTSLSEVRSHAAKIFDRVIIQQNMPVEPYPLLSPKERKILLNWFNSGMPE